MLRNTRREFLTSSLAGGVALACHSGTSVAHQVGPNEKIRVAVLGMGGFKGVGGRGRQLIDHLHKVPDCQVTALCDVDKGLLAHELEKLQTPGGKVKTYSDMRRVFDDSEIDAVFVALPNHWHALATIWGCEAGKDVYVEKPASYNLWEGRQMTAAARKYHRIVQVGTQARSDDATAQAVEYLRSGKLGKIEYAHAIIYRRRDGIGKANGPRSIPAEVDYNQWLGPAPQAELTRKELHYDWHWDWATGNGEIGNNGVHFLDRCRWAIGEQGLPIRTMSVGGRFAFDDDGLTPNTHIALLDYAAAPIICEVRNLAEKPGSRTMDRHRGIDKGIIIQCEQGAVVMGARTVTAQDRDGETIATFVDRRSEAEQASPHQVNFFAAMRSRRRDELTAEVHDGHLSTGLCHLANISHRLGSAASATDMMEAAKSSATWQDTVHRFHDHLHVHGVDLEKSPAILGPWVTLDPTSESFRGDNADAATALSRRTEYRGRFVVPELV